MTTEQFARNCIRWEASCPWMYLDTKGLVTVGVGNLLATSDAAVALPFTDRNMGIPAYPSTVRQAWLEVSGSRPGMIATYYDGGRPYLKDDAILALLISRLESEFVPGCRHIFIDFDHLPDTVQAALIDMAFNLGLAGLYHGFPKLCAAVRQGDWVTAGNECHRSTCREERNDWTRDLFIPGPVVV